MKREFENRKWIKWTKRCQTTLIYQICSGSRRRLVSLKQHFKVTESATVAEICLQTKLLVVETNQASLL